MYNSELQNTLKMIAQQQKEFQRIPSIAKIGTISGIQLPSSKFQEQMKRHKLLSSQFSEVMKPLKVTNSLANMTRKELYKPIELTGLGRTLQTIGKMNSSFSEAMKPMRPLFTIGNELSKVTSGLSSFSKVTLQPMAELGSILDTKFHNDEAFQKKLDEFIKNNNEDIEFHELLDELLQEDEETKIVDEAFDVLCEMSPDANILQSSIHSTQCKRAIIILFIIFIFNIPDIYTFYKTVLQTHIHYKVNKNNVRVRTSPDKSQNDNILLKLNKDTYVEKVDEDGAWVKIEFESDNGLQKEGWVYRTLISKID
jgi:hypothetical protein